VTRYIRFSHESWTSGEGLSMPGARPAGRSADVFAGKGEVPKIEHLEGPGLAPPG